MADYSDLKTAIRAAIYDNVGQDITGAVLQGILIEMVDELGVSYVKPETGIPATDLASAVQALLEEAGSAVQPSDLAAVALSGAYSDLTGRPVIPTALADLSADATHRTVTDTEKATWNGKSDFSGSYNDLSDKPTIPAAQVNSDWNAASGKAQILNKPEIPDALADLSGDSTHRLVTDAEKAAWNAKYDKPSSGIPKSDLASGVQSSLDKADTALQSHQDISGKADKVNGATSGDFASLNSNGNLVDSGKKASDFATAAQGGKADTAVQPGDLALVATSGDYDDLTDKPSEETWTFTLDDDTTVTKTVLVR